jgi:hypothetical protein
MREDGFYWVRHEGTWIIARWVDDADYTCWFVPNHYNDTADQDLDEIDERRIVRIV